MIGYQWQPDVVGVIELFFLNNFVKKYIML